MTIQEIAAEFYDTEFGQELVEQGREQGRVQGREQGRAQLLRELLVARFGDRPDLPETVSRLATWPDGTAIRAITTAATWNDLPKAPPQA